MCGYALCREPSESLGVTRFSPCDANVVHRPIQDSGGPLEGCHGEVNFLSVLQSLRMKFNMCPELIAVVYDRVKSKFKEVLRITKLATVFQICSTEATAVASFSKVSLNRDN